jgi:RHS repeat-associated protein
MNFGNLHGDTIISLQLPTTGYVTGPSELNIYDEYGVPQSPELDNRPIGLGVDKRIDTTQLFVLTYGSLGQPQRETTDTGIQFMGARGYNPITGQFLSPDPVQGGNETPYNYPNDPINNLDISGLISQALAMQNQLMELGLDIVAIALCIAFPAGCLALSIAIGMVSGGIAAFRESQEGLSSPATTFNHVLEGAVIGGISSGFGGIAGKGVKYIAKPLTTVSKVLPKAKRTAKTLSSLTQEAISYRVSKYSSEKFWDLSRNAQRRIAAKANICLP